MNHSTWKKVCLTGIAAIFTGLLALNSGIDTGSKFGSVEDAQAANPSCSGDGKTAVENECARCVDFFNTMAAKGYELMDSYQLYKNDSKGVTYYTNYRDNKTSNYDRCYSMWIGRDLQSTSNTYSCTTNSGTVLWSCFCSVTACKNSFVASSGGSGSGSGNYAAINTDRMLAMSEQRIGRFANN